MKALLSLVGVCLLLGSFGVAIDSLDHVLRDNWRRWDLSI